MAEQKTTSKEAILEAFAALSAEERKQVAADIVRLVLLEGDWAWLLQQSAAQGPSTAGCCPPGWGPPYWPGRGR